MSDENDTSVILINGFVAGETEYRMRVTGLPDLEATREFAQKMAVAAAGILADVMGAPPTGVAATGSGATDNVKAGIEKAGGTKITERGALPKRVEEALEQLIKETDDCQCPGCVARRAHEALLASGSNSDAKH